MLSQLTSTVSTIALSAAAVTMFQTATLIIGGKLAEELLEPFYLAVPQWWQRMLIVILPLPGFGNLLAAQAYMNPFVAGISFLIFGNWAALIAAAYIGDIQFDMPSIGLIVTISVLAILLAIRIS